MTLEDIITNLQVTCDQNNIDIEYVLLFCIMKKLHITSSDNDPYIEILNFKVKLAQEQDLLWDLQPSLEEDEEHAFAVQHARDIYDVLLGRF